MPGGKTAGVYVEHVRRGNGAPLPAAEDVRRRSAAIFRRIDVPTTIGCSGRPTDEPGPVTARLPNAAQPR